MQLTGHRGPGAIRRSQPPAEPEKFGDIVDTEARELDPAGAGVLPDTLEVGHDREQSFRVIVSQRRDHHQPGRSQGTDEMTDHRQRRPVCPVEVVEHQQDRIALRQASEQFSHGPEKQVLLSGRVRRGRSGQIRSLRPQFRQQTGQFARQ